MNWKPKLIFKEKIIAILKKIVEGVIFIIVFDAMLILFLMLGR